VASGVALASVTVARGLKRERERESDTIFCSRPGREITRHVLHHPLGMGTHFWRATLKQHPPPWGRAIPPPPNYIPMLLLNPKVTLVWLLDLCVSSVR
jgi:hypothetical protein